MVECQRFYSEYNNSLSEVTRPLMSLFSDKNKLPDDYVNFPGFPHPWHDNSLTSTPNEEKYVSKDKPSSLNALETGRGGMHDHVLINSQGGGSSRDGASVPVSPPHSGNSSMYFTSDHFSGSENETDDTPRKRRNPVPDSKKDDRYWERRKKNNMAAKRSREMKRKKVEDELHQAKDAITENIQLKQEVEVLKAEISSLRRLLKDANMTLSLWIKARQASELPSQLPPMIRNPTNIPYVTFPVTSSSLQ